MLSRMSALMLTASIMLAGCATVDEILDEALDDRRPGTTTTTTIRATTTTLSAVEFWGPQLTAATLSQVRLPVFAIEIPTGIALLDVNGVRQGWIPGTDLAGAAQQMLASAPRPTDPASEENLAANGIVTDLVTGATTVDGEYVFDLLPGQILTPTSDYRFISRHHPLSTSESTVFDRVSGESTALPDRCLLSDVAGGSWYLLCDTPAFPEERQSEIRVRTFDGELELVGGPGYGPFDTDSEGSEILGRWLWVEVGPEGLVLGQWSGRCDIASAHLVADDVVRSLYLDNGVPVLLPTDNRRTSELLTPESHALGWLPDGRVAVMIRSGECSVPAPDGIYTIDPASGLVEQIFPTIRPAALLNR